MQVELLDQWTWRTRVELANAIFAYLEVFHDRQRRHSALGMLTPVEFETRHRTAMGGLIPVIRPHEREGIPGLHETGHTNLTSAVGERYRVRVKDDGATVGLRVR